MNVRRLVGRHFVTLLFLFGLCIDCTLAQDAKRFNHPYGEFTGTLKLQPIGDGTHMLVLEAYSYSDKEGHSLEADPGFKTDGASIPRPLWSIVGSPFTGPYIGAAVIHDVGCDTHKYSWQVTHRMFYNAMRALGVSDDYAKAMYWGVRIGGPKWQEQVVSGESLGDLKRRVKGVSGKPLGDAPVKIYHTAGTDIYKVTVKVSLPQVGILTDKDAKTLYDYISSRDLSKQGAITLDEIDSRTPLTAASKSLP